MKATAEKSTTVTNPIAEHQPFFAKSGGQESFFSATGVQAKLAVNTPGDHFEQEADATAEKVMRMPAVPAQKETPTVRKKENEDDQAMRMEATAKKEEELPIQRKEKQEELVQRQCDDCAQKEAEKPADTIQRAESGSGSSPAAAPPIVGEVVSSGGSPMDGGTRGFMESRFGTDFSGVRVHTDSKSAESAQSISAHAYTVGNHVVFDQGQYNPQTDSGKTLIAHELTHVVQQSDQIRRRINNKAPRPASTAASPPVQHTPPARNNNPGATDAPALAAPEAAVPPTAAVPPAGAGDNAAAAAAAQSLLTAEPLMPQPPTELNATGQRRLSQAKGNAASTTTAAAALPAEVESTTGARVRVTEPVAETDARASGALAATLNQRPAPSSEIEALCENIRRVIREQRPPDEDSLLQADPEAAAQEAGTQLNENVSGNADRVGGEYDALDEAPAGTPEQIGVPVATPPEGIAASDINAAQATPNAIPEAGVSLENDVANTESAMESAGMNTEPAQLVQDGPIAEARAAHGELDETAQVAPAEVLAQQDAALGNARTDMEALQAQALQALQQSRSGTISGTGTQQTEMVGTEEEKRAALGLQAETLFSNAQTQVNTLLKPLTQTAMQMWDTGKERLATEFRQHLDAVQRWVDERHEGVGGAIVGLWDDITGMPSWVTDEYNDAESAFGDGVCDLILEISTYVNGIILTCEQLIDDADRQIAELFANAPGELGEWAAAEQERFRARLEGMRENVHETQQNFNQDLAGRAAQAVEEVRQEVHALREAAKGLIGRIADAIGAFLDDPVRFIIDGLLSLVGIEPARFWALVNRISQVIADIAADPLGFASNLMEAIGAGFQGFFDRIGTHLFNGLINWLFSGLGSVGIQIPRDFSLSSIITFFLQLMGISWERIRVLLARHVGEENVALIEQAFQLISNLIELGPEGIFQLIEDMLDPQHILDTIIQMAIDFITEVLITQITARIILLFNPVGAIAQAIEAIYRVLKWIFENAARIFTLVETVINGIADILAGNISGMAQAVETALAGLITPVIDFLADYAGLGSLPEQIADAVRGLQSWVEGILDRVIGWLAGQARAVLAALGIGGEDGEAGDGEEELEDSEVGETLTFTAGEEPHRLWIRAEGAGIAPMVASNTPKTVDDKLNEWENKMNDLSDEHKGQARNLIATARQQNQTVIVEGTQAKQEIEEARETPQPTEIAQANQADEETENSEATLKITLAQLFDLFREVEEINWKEETMMSFTLESGESHKLYIEEEDNGSKIPYMESSKVKIDRYLQTKKTEAQNNGNNNIVILVTEAETLSSNIVAISGQEDTATISDVIDKITRLSRILLEIEGLGDADLPTPAKYTPLSNGMRARNLSTQTIVRTGDPSGTNSERMFLQTAGHTANTSPDKWVRMHLIYDRLGGPSDPRNWVPAPNSVNTGPLVKGFERSVLQLVTTPDQHGHPNVGWAETRVLNYHPAHSRYNNLGGFAQTVNFKAGIQIPPHSSSTEWADDSTARIEVTVPVPAPPLSDLPALSSATGTSLRSVVHPSVAASTLFSSTTMDRIRDARVAGKAGNFTSVRNFVIRLIDVNPTNTRWINKVNNEIEPGVRILYDFGLILIG